MLTDGEFEDMFITGVNVEDVGERSEACFASSSYISPCRALSPLRDHRAP